MNRITAALTSLADHPAKHHKELSVTASVLYHFGRIWQKEAARDIWLTSHYSRSIRSEVLVSHEESKE